MPSKARLRSTRYRNVTATARPGRLRHDLALPHNAAGLGNDAYDVAAQARAAWEAAVCWDPSGTDQYAVRRLAEVRAIRATWHEAQTHSRRRIRMTSAHRST
jgi:hypothetical protein